MRGYETSLGLPYFVPNLDGPKGRLMSSPCSDGETRLCLLLSTAMGTHGPKLQPANTTPKLLAGSSLSSDDVKYSVNAN